MKGFVFFMFGAITASLWFLAVDEPLYGLLAGGLTLGALALFVEYLIKHWDEFR